jgi:hypothetical protein
MLYKVSLHSSSFELYRDSNCVYSIQRLSKISVAQRRPRIWLNDETHCASHCGLSFAPISSFAPIPHRVFLICSRLLLKSTKNLPFDTLKEVCADYRELRYPNGDHQLAIIALIRSDTVLLLRGDRAATQMRRRRRCRWTRARILERRFATGRFSRGCLSTENKMLRLRTGVVDDIRQAFGAVG